MRYTRSCGYSILVICILPKDKRRVRFPLPAPRQKIKMFCLGVYLQQSSNLFYRKFLKKSNLLRPAASRRKAAACLAEKFSLHFLFCARQISSSKRKRKFFCSAPRSIARGGWATLGRLGIPPLEPPCRAAIVWNPIFSAG